MNLVEKIIARHADKERVRPGEIVVARVDVALVNELSGIGAIQEFEKVGARRLWDPEIVVVVPDHFTPAKDIRTAEICRKIREWVEEHGVRHYFEVGRGGIEHVVLPDEGLVLPGSLIIGGDSHTVTYGALGAFAAGVGSTDIAAAWITGKVWLRVPEAIRITYRGQPGPWVYAKDLVMAAVGRLTVAGALYKAVEYAGPAVREMSVVGRLTMCNMVAEMGGKCGYVEPDEKVVEFLDQTPATDREWELVTNDPDVTYAREEEIDVDGMPPLVSVPPSPDRVEPVDQVQGIPLDQVFLGSCTNGRIEDLRIAAEILRGRRVHRRTRMIVVPGSQRVYAQAAREGLLELFVEAGAAVSTPTCGACVGGHMGVLGANETCLSTTNRNFVGRMGHVNARTYLCNPAVAAASAVAGEIMHPDAVLAVAR